MCLRTVCGLVWRLCVHVQITHVCMSVSLLSLHDEAMRIWLMQQVSAFASVQRAEPVLIFVSLCLCAVSVSLDHTCVHACIPAINGDGAGGIWLTAGKLYSAQSNLCIRAGVGPRVCVLSSCQIAHACIVNHCHRRNMRQGGSGSHNRIWLHAILCVKLLFGSDLGYAQRV